MPSSLLDSSCHEAKDVAWDCRRAPEGAQHMHRCSVDIRQRNKEAATLEETWVLLRVLGQREGGHTQKSTPRTQAPPERAQLTRASCRPLVARCHPSPLHSRWTRPPAESTAQLYANSLSISLSSRGQEEQGPAGSAVPSGHSQRNAVSNCQLI